jgi:15-cis-phytoene desaturase
MAQTVAILGGGVGGLSAAHELAERGFQVRLYERKRIFGGKARSVTVPNTGIDGRQDLPGEHGFRFFPSFYKHLPDTMARIPYGAHPHSVLDNLSPASRAMLARIGSPDVALVSRFPRSIEDWTTSMAGALSLSTVIPSDEALYYVTRLLVFLTSCEQRRLREYEHIPWWEFTGAASR